MEEEKDRRSDDDPYKLVQLGLARLSNLHPSYGIKLMVALVGAKGLAAIARNLANSREDDDHG
jgi:hypothetical protein